MLEIAVKTENWERHVRVSAEELAGLVRRIGGDGDRFLVVQRIPDLPDVFAQVWHKAGGDYTLEYRDGAADRHFQATVGGSEAVIAAITGWARREAGWEGGLAWSLLDMGPAREVGRREDGAEHGAGKHGGQFGGARVTLHEVPRRPFGERLGAHAVEVRTPESPATGRKGGALLPGFPAPVEPVATVGCPPISDYRHRHDRAMRARPPSGPVHNSPVLNGTLRAMSGIPRIGLEIVDVRDLVDIHIRAMTSPDAAGQRFLATGEFTWMTEMARILRDGLGADGRRVSTRQVPDFVVRLAARFRDRSLREITPALGRRNRHSTEKAGRVLGWQPRPARETVLDCVRSLIEHGAVQHI
ncbi:hypothetical protein OHB41_41600 [Streptomyces sp. NBC_01571]|uniref:hypothetical protein n=1 Tax=Streptomyces sp. NBC_01571 TaxID=2975883 RepID=UPI002256803D|nr:hypothetical protein [Streptomyces sp. NBC_01571]MCX4579572.1 hypothetical protein [Streptomyces sp. NBC_01571]